LEKFSIQIENIDSKAILENWLWLIGLNMKPYLISSMGDMFLTDSKGKVFWLNTGEGVLDIVSNSIEEFQAKLSDSIHLNTWFMVDFVESLMSSGLILSLGKIYSFKKLPILGGDYLPNNIVVMDIEEHFKITGYIHRQIKDLPEGTQIKFRIVD
jgi:hypothetical protein